MFISMLKLIRCMASLSYSNYWAYQGIQYVLRKCLWNEIDNLLHRWFSLSYGQDTRDGPLWYGSALQTQIHHRSTESIWYLSACSNAREVCCIPWTSSIRGGALFCSTFCSKYRLHVRCWLEPSYWGGSREHSQLMFGLISIYVITFHLKKRIINKWINK